MKIYLDNGAKMPTKAHMADAGYDLYTPIKVVLMPHSTAVIDTGVHMEIPNGYVGMIKSKSGLNVKHDILSEGVVDCGYTGSIVAKLYNHSDKIKEFEIGDKITQICIMPVVNFELEEVENLWKFADTERGDNGFGSSGR